MCYLGDKQPAKIEDRIWEPGIIQREEADTGLQGVRIGRGDIK